LASEKAANKLWRRARQAFQDSKTEAHHYGQRHPRLSAIGRVAASVMREQSAERVGLAASGAAFWLVISAFPTAIAVVSVYGLVVSPERIASDLGTLANGVPGSLGSLLSGQLRSVAKTDHADLSLGVALSLVVAVWSASAGFNNLDRAIRLAYGLPPQRYVEARGRAFVGALAVVLLLGLVAVVTPLVSWRSSVVGTALGVVAAIVVMTAGVGALYRFSVASHIAVRALLPGALTSAVGIVLVTGGFAAYVAGSTRYTAVYGAFAGAVVAMLAIYLVVYVVLLGAVLNTKLRGTASSGG
jgi:membrane protein